MEPNERHHHHHEEEQQQQQHLSSSYYNPFHHNPIAAAPSTGNSISSFNNGNFQLPNNDGSSSSSLFSVPSSAVNVPIDPVKRKRGRPRKYETPAQALAAKKLASSASNSSARERRKQAAIAGVTPPISESGSRKSLSGYSGRGRDEEAKKKEVTADKRSINSVKRRHNGGTKRGSQHKVRELMSSQQKLWIKSVLKIV